MTELQQDEIGNISSFDSGLKLEQFNPQTSPDSVIIVRRSSAIQA